jgi:hypothetical protein
MDGGGGGGTSSRNSRQGEGAVRRMIATTVERWRARRAARPPRRKREPEPKLPRSGLAASLEARLGVRAGVRLEDFLRHRLASYAARLPVPLGALPIRIEVDGGDIAVTSRARPLLGPSLPKPQTDPLAALAAREGPAPVREARDLATALAALEPRLADARARLEALARGLQDDLASGALAAAPAVEATAEQLGRPPVPPALPIHGLRGLAIALLGAVAWRLAGPVLAASGLSADDVARADAPVRLGLALAFAGGAAAALYAFLDVAVRRLSALAAGADAAGRRRLGWLVATGAAVLAAAVAAAGAAPAPAAERLLVLCVPLAAVLLVRAAAALDAARGAASAQALEWDRARTRELAARGRRGEAIDTAEVVVARLEAERDALSRSLRALERRAALALHADEEEKALDARRLERLGEALAAALEQDRYLFVRLSAAQGTLVTRPVRSERPVRRDPAPVPERLGVA